MQKEYIKEILFSEEKINELTDEIAKKLNKEYANKKDEIIVACLMKGAVPFHSLLIKKLNFELVTDYMIASSYEGGMSTKGNVKIIMDLNTNIENKNLIIIEDLIDSGLTLQKVVSYLKTHNPKSLKIVTLLNKDVADRKSFIEPDIYGSKCGDEFLVGFGLDYQEKLRNLPYIGVFDLDKWNNKNKK